MRFLLRMAFWLSVILVLLPRDESKPTSSAQIGAVDAVSAATATVGDLRQFCDRQPEACTVGSQAAVALGDRAKAGAKRLYDMLNERLTANENDGITTATSAGERKDHPPAPGEAVTAVAARVAESLTACAAGPACFADPAYTVYIDHRRTWPQPGGVRSRAKRLTRGRHNLI